VATVKLLVLGSLAAVLLPLLSFYEAPAPEQNAVTNYTVTKAKVDPYTIDIPKEEYVAPPAPIGDPYLMSLGQMLGVDIPIMYGSCYSDKIAPDQILGCYYPGSNKIFITEYALAWGEEHVKCVILHEYRHYYQDIKGLMRVQKGQIVNRDWLELDAYNYAGC
jgi:hypothetical protein